MRSPASETPVSDGDKGKPEGPFRSPRICMPSLRRFRRAAYHGVIYEAQDVLAETDDVDLIGLEPGPGYELYERWLRRFVWRDFTGRSALINPGLRTVHINRDYDLFIALCQHWSDLLWLNAVKGWKDRCAISVCWIDEMWASGIPKYRNWLPLLKNFDHVVVNLSGSLGALENALGRTCHWVPFGVDAIRFCPYPRPPARAVDVYSIGRKWEGVHARLLELAEKSGIFYIYDTFQATEAVVSDHKSHRDLISSIAKRSRFFLVAPAKVDTPGVTEGQSEIGSRYFEGAAAGAVLLGTEPETPSFKTLFGWQDDVIEIDPDGSDVTECLTGLAKQPDRLAAISRRNSAEALSRHDWAYRWEQILKISGISPRPAMEARARRLKQLAEMAKRAP